MSNREILSRKQKILIGILGIVLSGTVLASVSIHFLRLRKPEIVFIDFDSYSSIATLQNVGSKGHIQIYYPDREFLPDPLFDDVVRKGQVFQVSTGYWTNWLIVRYDDGVEADIELS